MMKARSALVAVSVALAATFILSGHAQAANPKYQACLKEAEGKGLLVTNWRKSHGRPSQRCSLRSAQGLHAGMHGEKIALSPFGLSPQPFVSVAPAI
jgi:hypothetical protein